VQAVKQRDNQAGGAEDNQRMPVEGNVKPADFHPRSLAACPGVLTDRLSPNFTYIKALALRQSYPSAGLPAGVVARSGTGL
jgi:hypothetical protein